MSAIDGSGIGRGNSTDIWVQRWEALDKLMQEIIGGLESRSLTRQPTLKTLVKCLKGFADRDFHYFYNGFNATTGADPLAGSAAFPDTYVYSVILEQIAHDLEVIYRAVQQRDNGSGSMRDVLLPKADKLAALALQPAIDHGLLPADTVALTYFEKSPAIRVIPYTRVALIAIPFTCVCVDRDLLAIPHEAGHFVFWHGYCNDVEGQKPIYRVALEKLKAKGIVANNSPLFETWYHWLQETFADVYGCLIAGPVMAKDFQDLQLHKSRSEFLMGDGTHPVPAMRPFIYQQVLHSKAASNMVFGAWANTLGAAWVKELNDRHWGQTVKLPQEIGIQAAPSSEILINPLSANFTLPRTMSTLVDIVLEILRDIPASDWTGGATAADLYSAFQNQIAALPNMVRDLTAEFIWDNWLGSLEADSVDWYTANTAKNESERDPDWLPILMAGGWTTEGPNDRWP